MPLLMSSTFAPMENGDYLWLGQDHGENLKEIARHSKHDADAYNQYSHDMEMVCQALKPLLDAPPPDLFSDDPEELLALASLGSRFRKMDKRTLHNTVRLLTGSAADFLDDYFESDIVKGYIASSAIIGTKVGPRSQGSGLVLLYHSIGEHDGEFGAWAFHKGGNGGFTKVLARAAQSFGAEIALESPVNEVITKNGRAIGVALEDGSEYHAKIVVSALDPRRTFLELVDPRELPSDLVETIQRFRFQGTSSKVNFALDGLPKYPALGDRGDMFRGFTNIGPSMDYLEHAFDDAKYGWYSQRPYMDCAIQSTIDADMAPPGKHVMSTFIAYTPYKLRESDWDTERQNLGDTVQATFESFFPGFSDLVLHREVVTPLDIERTVGLSEGNIFAGEFLAPQMYFFRPAPGWSQYRTPIDGYYQCGSGHASGRLRHGRPGQARSGTDPQGPRTGLTCLGHEDPRLTAARAPTRRGALTSVSVRSGGRRSRGVSRSTCQRTGSSSWMPRGHSKSIRGTIRSSRLAPSGITKIRRRRRASGMKTKSSAPMSARSRFTAGSLPALRRCYLQTSID